MSTNQQAPDGDPPRSQPEPEPEPGSPASVRARLHAFIHRPATHPAVRDATMLALERTRLSHERTLMAWIRTGLSLISFGFAIYGFFQLQTGAGSPFAGGLIGPRGFGSTMILVGLLAVLLAGVQHHRYMSDLRACGLATPRSMATLVALLVAILGLLALFTVAFG